MSAPLRSKEFKQYSAQHNWSAATVVSLLPPLEQAAEAIRAEVEQGNYSRLLSYRALVTGAIFSTVGFLEATINELFFRAGDWLMGMTLGFAADELTAFANAVPLVLERRGLTPSHRVRERARPLEGIIQSILTSGADPELVHL